ncbi:MAG TPA: ferredoxin [Frankiaceae bacterium]|nr:ferredoxin [Frankiaceae bacterium]
MPVSEAPAGSQPRLSVDWTRCDGRGLCVELLPELIARDDWGYPIIRRAEVPDRLGNYARQAVRVCPRLALRLLPPEA